MNYAQTAKELAVNAVFWTGLLAIILTLFEQQYEYALFAIGLIALNFAIILFVRWIAPAAFAREYNQANGELGFRVKPVQYPKVLDEDKRQYLPEFIHLDITTNKQLVFTGNLARNALKQLRDAIDQALSAEEPKIAIVSEKKKKIKS